MPDSSVLSAPIAGDDPIGADGVAGAPPVGESSAPTAGDGPIGADSVAGRESGGRGRAHGGSGGGRPDGGGSSGGTQGDGEPGSGERVDGRRARRERNREAVVDAVLELVREGNLRPSTDQIAERAGLSPRSLFRYFDDVDDLFGIAIRKQARFFREHLRLDIDPSLSLHDRIVALVAHRLDLYDAIGGVGVVARANEPFRPQVREELAQFRALVREQLRIMLTDDLTGLVPEVIEQRLTAAELLCSFEAYRLLVDDRGLDRAGVADVMVEGLIALLTTS